MIDRNHTDVRFTPRSTDIGRLDTTELAFCIWFRFFRMNQGARPAGRDFEVGNGKTIAHQRSACGQGVV
jgi:hypothetical protein